MMKKVISRLDAFALALGGVSTTGSFGVLPFGALPRVTADRIYAAWDKKLRERALAQCPEFDRDCANAGWVT